MGATQSGVLEQKLQEVLGGKIDLATLTKGFAGNEQPVLTFLMQFFLHGDKSQSSLINGLKNSSNWEQIDKFLPQLVSTLSNGKVSEQQLKDWGTEDILKKLYIFMQKKDKKGPEDLVKFFQKQFVTPPEMRQEQEDDET